MSIVKTYSNIRTTLAQAQIISHLIPRLDPIDTKSSLGLMLSSDLLGMSQTRLQRPAALSDEHGVTVSRSLKCILFKLITD